MEIKEHPLLPFSLGEKGLQLPVPNQEEIDGAFQRLEAVPHSIVTEILEKLSSQILRELGVEWGVKDALEKLGSIVLTTTPVLTDAARKRMENEEIGEWLEKFILAVYDADDLVDDFSTEALQRKVMIQEDKYWGTKKVRIFFSSSNQLVFRFKTGRKFKAIRKVLRAIAENRIYISRLTKIDHDERRSSLSTQVGDENNYMMEYYNRKETLSFFVQPAAAADQEEEVVIGREEEKLDIVNKLVDCEFDVSVIPIVGTAGVGKTALAKLVYSDERVTNHFELKMWVCFSDVFDMKMIAKEMIESATGRKVPEKLIHHHMDGVIQDRHRKEIDRKRFLLVLDNVWNEEGDLWLQLSDLLMGGERGSKILLTTCSEYKVAMYPTISPLLLEPLPFQASWSLFKITFQHGEEQNTVPHVVEIEEQILNMCQGLPLAIRALGGLLHAQDADDELLLASKTLEQKINEERFFVLPILRLNYDHLPSYLKRCFEFCSLYPKERVIYKKDLIRLWVAHGLIQPVDKNPDLEDVGDLYFQDLLRRSFFQYVERDEWGDIVSCKMHDVISDLARFAAGKENFVLNSDAKDVPSTIRHVSFASCEGISIDILANLRRANKIRTFLLHGQRIGFGEPNSLVSEILELTRLRVLDLHCLGIKTVPSCISKLQYLRYLDLSENCAIKSLPSSITLLQNLQTLKLSGCCHLEELPKETRKLVSLRHLELDGCIGLTRMPYGLGQLTSLRTLTLFVLDTDNIASKLSGGLSELKGLTSLRGELTIERLGRPCSASTTEEAQIEEANFLKEKQHLQSLQLKWTNDDDGGDGGDGDDDDDADDELVLIFEGLQPHPNLKRLSVTGYGSLSFPSWMMSSGLSLPNLVKITIADCSRCEQLPQFGQLHFLQVLELSQLASLEYIDNSSRTNGGGDESLSFSPSSSTGGRELTATFFPSLKKLLLNGLTNLKGWWRCEAEEPMAFPSLSVSAIQNCPKLASMPLHPCVEELELMQVSEKLVQQQFTMMATATIPTTDPMLPSSLSSQVPLSKLKSLCIQYIDDLVILPERAIESLTFLRFLEISWCPRLTSLSEVMWHLTALEKMEINDCPMLDLLEDDNGMHFKGLRNLTSLKIKRIPKLVHLPVGLQRVTTLKSLYIERCVELITLKNSIGKLESLQRLVIFDCHKLTSLPDGIRHLTSLMSLEIDGCQELDLSDGFQFQGLRNLSSLTIKRNPMLVSLPVGFQYDSSLQSLEIHICENLTALPYWIGNLKSLKRLSIYGCPKLASLPEGMHGLTALKVLSLHNCHPSLYKRCHKETGEDWPKIANIPNVSVC